MEALKGVDLSIEPGEVVALVGKSGSGKSTLLNLLLRFYDPTEGRVCVGGRDVRELESGVAPQPHRDGDAGADAVFADVAENIGYGVSGADRRRSSRPPSSPAPTSSSIGCPDGYDAPIGDRGVQLSGGQRQRLAIARAVLRRPSILILDEATSALDAELESIVQVALRTLDYRPTTLIIAHRLSTVAHVDRVVVLDEGRIVESGTHDELIHTSTFYRQLVQTQLVAQ